MRKHIDIQIYQKASKAYENLTQAIEILEGLTGPDSTLPPHDYYRARNLLREGEKSFKEALGNAKKLLGPLPGYVAEDYAVWRTQSLNERNVLAHGRDIDDLIQELSSDDLIGPWMSEDEIKAYLEENFENQQSGKRKLENIKVRMILDKLETLIARGKELNKLALQQRA